MRYLLLLFLTSTVVAQNTFKGKIIDVETNKPLEFVSVFNNYDNTITNADGNYMFSSDKDSVIIYRMGYEKIRTTFNDLKPVVKLQKSPFELNTVVIGNTKKLWQTIKDSLNVNYVFEPYHEKFTLRTLVRYNDTISRIQDIKGKLKRKTLVYTKTIEPSKKDYEVEFTNMRKIGVVTDPNNVYFKFPTLHQLFLDHLGLVNVTASDNFEFSEIHYDNENKIKLEFITKPKFDKATVSGYYLINAKNKAIEEFYFLRQNHNLPYVEKRWLKSRTTFFEKHLFFEAHPSAKKYYLKTAKSRGVVETTDKDNSFLDTYDVTNILTTNDNFGDFTVKKNVSSHKDIFKLKYPYHPEFWDNQNQLLLTDEMNSFITLMNKEDNEFKVKTNMK